MIWSPSRRAFIQAGGAALVIAGARRTAMAQAIPASPESGSIKMGIEPWLGYGQWHIAAKQGLFKKAGLDSVEIVNFTADADINAALAAGQLQCGNIATHTAMNFIAAGLPLKIVALLDVSKTADAMISDGSVTAIKDLKGKQVATTRGTTAHNILHQALKSVGLDSTKDVEIVNQRMSEAVTSFIAGAVPAVALWVPFNIAVKTKAPKAKLITDAGSFPSATIVDGWAARNDLYEKNKETLKKIIRAWVPANDYLLAKPEEALTLLHKKYYQHLSMDDMWEMYKAAKWFPSAEWRKHYQDGSAVKWLNQVTNFNVEVGAIQNPMMADKYFDPSLFVEVTAK